MITMPSFGRSTTIGVTGIILFILLLHVNLFRSPHSQPGPASLQYIDGVYRLPAKSDPEKFDWARRPQLHPVQQYLPLPVHSGAELPKVQYAFTGEESSTRAAERRQRLAEVKFAMKRSWDAYRRHAWLADELLPVSGGNKTAFGGWAATLVDSLDTLWIMDLKEEFKEAVDSIVQIDFTATTQKSINVFETTIRYLGGFLSAYDLSDDKRLLDKSLELADMLYAAFDTPNRMPILRWDFHAARKGEEQVASDHVVLAEMGSLCLEFTRLSQITRDPRWYDAVARVMDVFRDQQYQSNIPGMWPLIVNGRDMEFFSKHSSQVFSIAALGDSVYEYLPKMYALLGGSEQYAAMFNGAMNTLMKHSLFRPMTKQGDVDALVPGALRFLEEKITVQAELQHLSCFSGGMFALGGKLLQNDSYVAIGRKLTDGCIWAYDNFPTKIMPEVSNVVRCKDDASCPWDEDEWNRAVYDLAPFEIKDSTNSSELIKNNRLPPGIASIPDPGYRLRPEAIESIFINYRITGDESLQDTAWSMFKTVYAHTRTEFAHAAMKDVTNGTAPMEDSMESFWTAETLKYYYLVFCEPEYVSLDDYVFNTEAHPFRRPEYVRGG
ncbi:unnamed protein product [Zymoseptoria tritici ST99CH_3D1]|nr:unnamed protein product [Zymoseptoria tritici ST99CH_3D1]